MALPLPALLSQALVAFAIDYEAEARLSLASTTVLQVPGLDTEAGTRVADLPPPWAWHGHGHVEVGPGKVVRLTPYGRAVRDEYRPLTDAVEARWRDRFGAPAVGDLRSSAAAQAAGLDPGPHGGGLDRRVVPRRYGRRMARLIYATIASLDGYVADPAGNFEWAAPDEEVHAAVNDLQRPIGTYLYGRRMYETMAYWDTPEPLAEDQPPVMRDFARMWRAADKVVYSTTLEAPTTARTRLEPAFDPEAVRALIRAADRDVTIGGPTLAARAWRAGLVDECHVFAVPTLVGGGTSTYPAGVSAPLVLVDEHRFTGGVVHLHYRVDRSA